MNPPNWRLFFATLALPICGVGCASGPARLPAQTAQVVEVEDGERWFQEINQLIKTHSVKTVAALLPLLPKELRARHALSFGSLSLQHSDFQRPRVLLASPKAKFVMTFNGAVDQTGFEAIETMRFTSSGDKPRFIFEEIVMEDDLKARRAYLKSKGNAQASAELIDRSARTGPNPELCLTCHRSDPRPNWEHYSFWPKFYGQSDDRPLISKFEETDPTSGEKVTLDNSRAVGELRKFIRAAPKNKRYRHLVDLRSQIDLEGGPQAGRDSRKRTNSKVLSGLTHDLAQLNFSRIARLIRESDRPGRYRILMLMNSAGCSLVQAGEMFGFKKSLESYYKQYQLISGKPDDHLLTPVPRFAFLFQDSKVPWEDFFMNFYPGPGNNFVTPFYGQDELAAWLVADDPNLSSFYKVAEIAENGGKYAKPIDETKICEKLTTMLSKNK